MKCPSCGSEISEGRFCPFCGTQIDTESMQEKEFPDKEEYQNSYNANESINKTKPAKKRKTLLWILGWIFIFPLPLTLILLKKKKMKSVFKYGLIIFAWIIYLFVIIPLNITVIQAVSETAEIINEAEDFKEINEPETEVNGDITEKPIIEETTTEITTGKSQTESTSSRVYIKYSATELFDLLENNALKAKSLLEDAYVEVSGYVSNIDASGEYISIGAESDNYEYFLDSIHCSIKDDATREKVMDLAKDDYITIKGQITSVGEVLGYSMNIESIS